MYGRFLREVRQSRELTQLQLSEIVGISQSNISAYESDRRIPSADSLNKIVVACGYVLAAKAGTSVITCDLPKVGWFTDDDTPARDPGDPPESGLPMPHDAPMADRVERIRAVLALADHIRAVS
jgi:transcriptional regulator with XRE-family HTH domain